MTTSDGPKIAVVIPSYRVRDKILEVLARIGPEVSAIYVVDDGCPDGSGRWVEEHNCDPRVTVIYNAVNLGVGGATLAGMRQAREDGCGILVKIDGDGQMDPAMIGTFCAVILSGQADLAKGNRFFEVEGLKSMPRLRLLGNAGLSLLSKLSTGYWHVFDPTNGFLCMHGVIFDHLPVDKIEKRYFFESDLLFRLNVLGATVVDIPMHSFYDGEKSEMRPMREVLPFFGRHARNTAKRIFYNYFLRDFSIGSLELVLGLAAITFGLIFGLLHWGTTEPATSGTVMVAALPIITGTQLVIAFLNYDIRMTPHSPLHSRLSSPAFILRPLRHAGWKTSAIDGSEGDGASSAKTRTEEQ
ncbi:DPM/DPG synthase family glycosyltransferase [Aestuariivirga sp.]|uniref:glycosyltransferase family 2 protein n=1 Tax=Aestuariivirga sp. TaxID=2650926 RepID=UPI0030168A5E